MNLEKKTDIKEEAVKTIPIKIVKNPKFYKIVEDYINTASEFFGIDYKKDSNKNI